MKEVVSRLKLLLIAIFHTSGWAHVRECDVLVVRHDADCAYQYDGRAYSPIIDTIVETCFYKGLSVQSIATPFSRLMGQKAFNSPAVFNRPFMVIALLARFLSPFIGNRKSKEWAVSRKAALWLKILRLIKPKLVIGIQPDVGLCRACRDLNIPVYDIQHGVISRDDKWYGETLPKEVKATDLPTGFLCWDYPSSRDLQTWAPNRGATVSIVGHPWFQRFQYPDDKDQLVREAKRGGSIFSDQKPVVLVVLQWGLHLHYYPESDFNKVMCKALEAVIQRTHDRYNWLLRLHPVQMKGVEGKACEEYLSAEFGGLAGVDWHNASLIPLPLLLSQVDLHITDMSSVVIEASWFGLPSALLNPYLNKGGVIENMYEYERASGIATVVAQDVDSIESWIEEKLSCARETSGLDIPQSGIKALLDKVMVTNK